MIQITEDTIRRMNVHAVKTFPNECCGFFFGSATENGKLIDHSFEVNNSKEGDQRRRFEIAPEDYMQGEAYSEQNNILFAGIYHSHPGHPAVPSEHDRKQAVPFFSYIILSVTDTEVIDITSWMLNDQGNFKEEEINILKTKTN